MTRLITAARIVLATALRATSAVAQRSTPVELLVPGGAENENFGWQVAVWGDTMVVGAPNTDAAEQDQGAVHVYRWTGSNWLSEATLYGSGTDYHDYFGKSVAICGDTLVVGAPGDSTGSCLDCGAAYVFTRSGTTWTETARLFASNSNNQGNAGESVAIWGDTIVVGATGAAPNFTGAAYVFVRTAASSAWTQQATLAASDGATFAEFGNAVSIWQDTVVVGTSREDRSGLTDPGAAYVFTRSGATWTQQAKLTASDAANFDNFGVSVALHGETIAVGAWRHTETVADQGAVYVFTRSGTVWSESQQLVAPDALTASDNYFGMSVGLIDGTLVVGAPGYDSVEGSNTGAAYVFRKFGADWLQTAKLTSPTAEAGDNLGWSVATWGDTALCGAAFHNEPSTIDQGSAWVFSRVGTKWIGPDLEFQDPTAFGAENADAGSAVAISGETVAVGAPFRDFAGLTNTGACHVLERRGVGEAWTIAAMLLNPSASDGDTFGWAVSVSGDTAVVGAPSEDVNGNTNQGTVSVFVRHPVNGWQLQQKLIRSDGAAFDRFGEAVAIDGDLLAIGAPDGDAFGQPSVNGAVLIYERQGTTWTLIGTEIDQYHSGSGNGDARFGASVALSGTTLVVGDPDQTIGGEPRGKAFVFVRRTSGFGLEAQLTAADGALGDRFGDTVATSEDTVVVGAPERDSNGVNGAGAAYAYRRAGTVWHLEAELGASDPTAQAHFGSSVAVSGNTAVIGAHNAYVNLLNSAGVSYVFNRAGSRWVEQTRLIRDNGAAGDFFGAAVAISQGTVVIGATGVDGGAPNQGAALSYDLPYGDLPVAHNDPLDATYTSLAASFTPAQSGHVVVATPAAFRAMGAVGTLGRSMGISGYSNIRTPSNSSLTLGGSSFLSAPAGNAIDVFGQLVTSSNDSAAVFGDSFTLGFRGVMTARTGSSLTINAPSVLLQGQTFLQQGTALTFGAGATAMGPINASFNATIAAGDTLCNMDTLSLTAGTIYAPLFWNRSAANIFGSSAIFGSFTNEVGALTNIRSGSLYVFGSFTNNGTVMGTLCANCSGSPPNLDVGGDLVLGPAASLSMPFTGSLVHVGGDFDCAIDSNARYHMSLATLQLEGSGSVQTLELMSTDLGANAAGLDRDQPGHYPIGILELGPTPSTILLVDAHDNDGLGQAALEAIYVDTLTIHSGARLVNPNVRIYYNSLTNDGFVDFPENLISLATPPCDPDVNCDGSVNGFDIEATEQAINGDYSNFCQPTADLNNDGAENGFDIETEEQRVNGAPC